MKQASSGDTKKIVGVFYKANEYAKNPNFLGCVENALGIRNWLESQGHQYIVTDDKEGPDCGKYPLQSMITWKIIKIAYSFLFFYKSKKKKRKKNVWFL